LGREEGGEEEREGEQEASGHKQTRLRQARLQGITPGGRDSGHTPLLSPLLFTLPAVV
jgi:hypothetical protein